MSDPRPLQGGCSCGRNHYSILLPKNAIAEQAKVYFDDSSENRRAQATPLTAWLRVPLTWYTSSTQAHFSDETHNSIRRIFTPNREPHCKRIFCGYCGTHLSYWTEEPATESEYMNITLGSLFGEDLRTLQELDLLPEDVSPEDLEVDKENNIPLSVREENSVANRTARQGIQGDMTWFEEMIDGSRLGRTQKKRKGMGISADRATTFQWEVTEYRDEDSDQTPTSTTAKRKIEDVGSGEDVSMKT